MIIIDGADHNDDDDGDQNSYTLDPGDLWVGGIVGSIVTVEALCGLVRHAVILIDTQGNRNNGSDQQQDLKTDARRKQKDKKDKWQR